MQRLRYRPADEGFGNSKPWREDSPNLSFTTGALYASVL
jgi:hypothetical protein